MLISLWLSLLTRQIYEVRQIDPFFVVTSLNPLIEPDLVGGGVLQLPFVHLQALGEKTGPFSVGQLLVRTEPGGDVRLQGSTHFFDPTRMSWSGRTLTVDWVRLR